jgi:hypothetical protein
MLHCRTLLLFTAPVAGGATTTDTGKNPMLLLLCRWCCCSCSNARSVIRRSYCFSHCARCLHTAVVHVAVTRHQRSKEQKVLTSVKEIVKETQQCLYIKTSVHSISRCTLRYSCDATQTCMANSINRHIIGIVHMNLSSKMNRCNCNE